MKEKERNGDDPIGNFVSDVSEMIYKGFDKKGFDFDKINYSKNTENVEAMQSDFMKPTKMEMRIVHEIQGPHTTQVTKDGVKVAYIDERSN